MRTKTFLIAVLLLCSVPCSATSKTSKMAEPKSPFQVVSAEFGLLKPAESESENPEFQSTAKVPLTPGQGYGWIIQLDTTRDTIRWREEFTLPAAPERWGSEETEGVQVVSGDRKTSVTEREVQPENGLISNFWEVAAGDPQGRYAIRVFVEDTLVATFEFDVE